MSARLTPAMKRHLIELHDAPWWNPTDAGEWAVARALERRGYLTHNPDRMGQHYKLSEAGRNVAAGLLAEGER